MDIKKLSRETAADFLDFFDGRAFTDHKEWSGCYCTWFHADKEREKLIGERCKDKDYDALAAELRLFAEELINNGELRGFLAYDGGKAIGFVNANRTTAYAREKLELKTKLFTPEDEDTLSVTCFTVAPEHRLKGVATALLERVCKYAEEAGFKRVEGYPVGGDYTPFDFEGPVRLYAKLGFVKVKDGDNAVYKEV